MRLSVHHLLEVDSLSDADIELILETARRLRERFSSPPRKQPLLRGRSAINVFFEPSTRTRTSFELAAKRLGADAVNFTASSSSLVKGESIRDTARTLRSMDPDVLIVRHSEGGVPRLVAEVCPDTAVINAGDGMHEHPTQALLDLLTVLDHRKDPTGATAVIVGDISHSRVARSNARLLSRRGLRVVLCGPPTLLPPGVEVLGAEVDSCLDRAVEGAEIIICLRSQRERQREGLVPSDREYARLFGLDSARLARAAPDAIVLHPGPVNRGIELMPEVADGPHSAILDQVRNGVAVRMALLCLLTGTEVGRST